MNFSVKPAHTLLIVIILILVFFSTLTVSSYLNLSEQKQYLHEELMLVRTRFSEIINTSENLMNSLTSFRQASDRDNSSQLTLLTDELFKRYPYLESVLFQNWVDESSLVEFELGMRKEGWPGYTVYSNADKLSPRNFLGRNGYLPVSFIEPLSPTNVFMMGKNMLDYPVYKIHARQVVEEGKISLFRFDNLLRHNHKCLALLQATYFGFILPESGKNRQLQFDGFFLLLLDMDKILQAINATQKKYQLQVIEKPPEEESSQVFSRNKVVLSQSFFAPHTGVGIKVSQTLSISELVHVRQWLYASVITLLAGFFFSYKKNQQQTRKKIKETSDKLKQARIYAERTLSAMTDGVILIDANGKVQLLNPKAESLTGFHNKEAVGKPLNSILSLYKDDLSTPVDVYNLLIEEDSLTRSINLKLINADKSTIILEVKVTRVNPLSEQSGLVIVLRDVSLEQELTDELTYQASHDNLTGLYNRMAFENQVKTALMDNVSNHREHTALYLDLDRFKLVNDTCGHAAGDELLKIVSGILRAELREQDFLARLGGDEFGVLFWDLPLSSAREIAERLQTTIRDFRFEWEGKVFDTRASIGLSKVNTDTGTLKNVMMAVDLACLSAKESGRDMITIYENNDDKAFNHKEEMNWLPRINAALEQDRYELFFQPIRPVFNNPQLKPIREILIRMRGKDGQLILPTQFIPPAERYDVMNKLDCWVIKNLIDYLNGDKDSHNGSYSINLSGQSLSDPKMAGYIEGLLSSVDIPAEKICFEITETAAIANLNAARNFIEQMHKLGCCIMLDDFGSGLSSFAYLKALPIDYIKIDGQFIQGIANDPVNEAMVRMIHEIAQVMHIKTIAEFVETEESFELVRKIGIDYIQGYLIARPQPL